MNQRGFAVIGYVAIGAAVIIGGLALALKIQTSRLESKTAEYEGFKAKTAALGEAAQKAADAKYAKDLAAKEKANADQKRANAALVATVAKLRKQRPAGDILPPTASTASRPDIAAFKRAELERALRDFDAEIQGLVDEGSGAMLNLNVAKEWAKQLQ